MAWTASWGEQHLCSMTDHDKPVREDTQIHHSFASRTSWPSAHQKLCVYVCVCVCVCVCERERERERRGEGERELDFISYKERKGNLTLT